MRGSLGGARLFDDRAAERRRETARALREAIDRSLLARFPAAAREQLIREGRLLDVPAGAVVHREGDPPSVALLVGGLARAFKSTGRGREATIRYLRPGDVLGLVAAQLGVFTASIQALSRCSLFVLPLPVLEALESSDTEVAGAIAGWIALIASEATDRLLAMHRPLAERVAWTLLDLARNERDGALVAPVAQRELANATEAARESVARVLRGLRSDGVVTTSRDRVVILRPDELLARARSSESPRRLQPPVRTRSAGG